MCNQKTGKTCIYLMDTLTKICVNTGNLCTLVVSIEKKIEQSLERSVDDFISDINNHNFWEKYNGK